MHMPVFGTFLLSAAIALTMMFGFVFPRANLHPEANTLLASWQNVDAPNDYSASTTRFAFELGRLQLFGKPVEVAAEASLEAAAAQSSIALIAIARLDNKPVALIKEDKPFPVRLSIGQQTGTGWQISEIDIEASTVTMTRADQTQVLRLYPVVEDNVPG